MDILFEHSPLIFETNTIVDGDGLLFVFGNVNESVIIINNTEIFF